MFFDLFHLFPLPEEEPQGKKKGKGKAKAGPQALSDGASQERGKAKDCWDGIESVDKDSFARRVALAGHLGYSVVGCTISPPEPSSNALPSPFSPFLPFPQLDPRSSSSSAAGSSTPALGPSGGTEATTSRSRPPLVQVTRYHIRLSDSRTHCLTNQNTAALKEYDILSVAPLTDKAFQLACTDMSNPGPNQISIITLPLHERPFTFRFNRKQMRQAQRNGVVFELLYAAALFPSPSLPSDIARRYRQNFLANAREVVRITGGKGIIFSSGPGGSDISLRGPMDIVNLGTMLGIPSNLAKEAVEKTPRAVLLRAQARRTFKAIMSMPKLVAPQAPPTIDRDQDPTETESKSKSRSGASATERVPSGINDPQGDVDVPMLATSPVPAKRVGDQQGEQQTKKNKKVKK